LFDKRKSLPIILSERAIAKENYIISVIFPYKRLEDTKGQNAMAKRKEKGKKGRHYI
jgi:hypothetical protein